MRNEDSSLSLPGSVLAAAERLGCFLDLGRRTRPGPPFPAVDWLSETVGITVPKPMPS
jgi:hypothetical protein